MIVSKNKTPGLGRRISYPVSYFNTDSIYFSDEAVVSDVLYAERIKIIKHRDGSEDKGKSF